MSYESVKPTFQSALEANDFCYGAEVVTSRGYTSPGLPDRSVALATELASDARIAWLSITDNPGGGPMLPPDFLSGKLSDSVCPLVIHLTCKDANRSAIESAAWRYAAEGCRNILALTGDYPTSAFGGQPQPVFDLDSVTLVAMLGEMNAGLQITGRGCKPQTLPSTDFYIGCAVSPFKRHERELMPQYFKLLLKIDAGARWVVPQLGYDMRKFNEIRLLLSACELDVPVIGNVYLLNRGVARLFNQRKLPGCVVNDKLFALAEKYASGEDKGREFFRDLAAKQLAVFKGLGFAAGYLGGIARADTFFDIIERAENFAENDWREFLPEICFSQPDEFFLFHHDAKTGLASPDAIDPEFIDTLKHKRRSREASLNYRVSRAAHGIAFTRGKGFYGALRRLHALLYRNDKPGFLGHSLHRVEQISKRIMYGCEDCGDCSLPEIAYICPNSACSKNQRNGPCGGSTDGQCEVGEKQCIWTRAYLRLAQYADVEALARRPIVIHNPAIRDTSAWANLYLDRDHTADKVSNAVSTEADANTSPTSKQASAEHSWERLKEKIGPLKSIEIQDAELSAPAPEGVEG